MENSKAIDRLNSLIQINNDRIAGYQHASKETEDTELKNLFDDLQANSEAFNEDLSEVVSQLGGTVVTGTMTSGKLYRAWMDVKAALTGKDRKAILSSCEFGEDVAVKGYKEVLANEDNILDANTMELIEDQYALLMDDHNMVKDLRDALKEA